MTAPFEASKLFQNSASDGWDDWDWVDNSNATATSTSKENTQKPHNTAVTSVNSSPFSQPAEMNASNRSTPSNVSLQSGVNSNYGIHFEQNTQNTPNVNQHFDGFNNNNYLQNQVPQYQNSVNENAAQIAGNGLQQYNIANNAQQADINSNLQHGSFVHSSAITPPLFYQNPAQPNFELENPGPATFSALNNNSDLGYSSMSNTSMPPPPPPRSISPPPLEKSPYANTNPFKRVNLSQSNSQTPIPQSLQSLQYNPPSSQSSLQGIPSTIGPAQSHPHGLSQDQQVSVPQSIQQYPFSNRSGPVTSQPNLCKYTSYSIYRKFLIII